VATQTISDASVSIEGHRKVLRYRRTPRLVHMLLAVSFLLLLFTGLMIFLPFLAEYAAGGTSRLLHRIGAVVFMAVPILYLVLDRQGAKELLWDSFHYDRDDLEWFRYSYRYFMGKAADMPPQGRLNAGQKLHHAGVVIFSAVIVITGALLWFGKGSLGVTGLALTAGLHDIAMVVLTVLLAGHLYFTFVYKALSGMTTGYVDEEEARIEHAKWVAELEEHDGVLTPRE
jgi:formate dehydrogenase subunit gamma